MSYTAIGQLIAIVALPMITRIFTPEQFGLFSFFVTAVTLIGTIATGMYHRVILITKKHDERIQILYLVFLLSLIAAFFSWLGIYVLISFGFLESWQINQVSNSVIFILAIFFYANSQSLYVFLNIYGSYNVMGISTVLRDFFAASGKLLLGYLGIVNFGMIYAFLGSQIIFSFLMAVAVIKILSKHKIRFNLSLTNLFTLAKKYIRFPTTALPTDFIALFSIQAPLLFLGPLFGAKVLGFYALARSVAGVPAAFLGGAIGSVFQKEAADQFNKTGNCSKVYKKFAVTIFTLILLPCLLLMAFSQQLFEIVFGDQWSTAGAYCAILAPLYCFRLISKPLGFVFQLTKHLRFDFLLVSIFVIASVFSLGLGYLMNSSELTIYLISITHSCCYLIYLYFGYRISQGKRYKTG